MRTLIKNGIVVNAAGKTQADVLVEDGAIVEVKADISPVGADIIDAAGCYVFPGFIDPHTHFDLDLSTMSTADDFQTGSRAAILGGTTTIVDFATQERGMTLNAALDKWHKKARVSNCNYGFHMALSEWNEALCNEMGDMAALGVTSYKMYMVYPALRVDDGEIYCAMKRARDLGALLSMHCENWDLLQRMIKEQHAKGIHGPEGHPLSRPAEVEAEAVNRYLRIAQLAQAPAYVVHLSTGEGLAYAKMLRERKRSIYLETCPQYLTLDDARYQDPDGAKYVMSPPLRKKEDNERLWEGLKLNEIDTLGTDHCSFTMTQKTHGNDDFSDIPNGSAGVQNRASLYYTYGVKAGIVTLEQMAAQLSQNAAKLFGMYPKKGKIEPGCDADIVVFDPNHRETISYKTLAHNCDNSPYEGMEVFGKAKHVLLGGEHAVNDSKLAKPGLGKYVKRALPVYYR
ncbi:dihydropyrimidinase [Christensenellaceae bacterium OttesenSCG-928-M15]|nr:dihydropyrimidinase [Christensenellaceae bacterium OttesenSCG-928-M15]